MPCRRGASTSKSKPHGLFSASGPWAEAARFPTHPQGSTTTPSPFPWPEAPTLPLRPRGRQRQPGQRAGTRPGRRSLPWSCTWGTRGLRAALWRRWGRGRPCGWRRRRPTRRGARRCTPRPGPWASRTPWAGSTAPPGSPSGSEGSSCPPGTAAGERPRCAGPALPGAMEPGSASWERPRVTGAAASGSERRAASEGQRNRPIGASAAAAGPVRSARAATSPRSSQWAQGGSAGGTRSRPMAGRGRGPRVPRAGLGEGASVRVRRGQARPAPAALAALAGPGRGERGGSGSGSGRLRPWRPTRTRRWESGARDGMGWRGRAAVGNCALALAADGAGSAALHLRGRPVLQGAQPGVLPVQGKAKSHREVALLPRSCRARAFQANIG